MGTPEICRQSSQAAQISDVLSALPMKSLGLGALPHSHRHLAGQVEQSQLNLQPRLTRDLKICVSLVHSVLWLAKSPFGILMDIVSLKH